MEVESETLECHEKSVKECVPDELVLRIKKLRWMGMDDEAAQLQSRLHEIHQAPILLSGPSDTD